MQDALVVEWIRQKYDCLWPAMNERMRRRWAATEALSLGWGGVTTVAVATGLTRKTIHFGIRELEAEAADPGLTLPPDRVRRAGAGRLSGGECQRACIAACLAAGARTLILDEPLNMLDPIVQEEIIELLASLREDGSLSYLIVTHDFALVSRLCEQVLVLSEGTVVETGTTTEILENPKHRITQELVGACPWRSSV